MRAEYVNFPKGSNHYVFQVEKVGEDGSVVQLNLTQDEAEEMAKIAAAGVKFVPHLGYQGL